MRRVRGLSKWYFWLRIREFDRGAHEMCFAARAFFTFLSWGCKLRTSSSKIPVQYSKTVCVSSSCRVCFLNFAFPDGRHGE